MSLLIDTGSGGIMPRCFHLMAGLCLSVHVISDVL
jgi:hypothetical protein